MKPRKFIKNSIRHDGTLLNIWIDGYEANAPQRLGSSQVAFELLNHIEKIDKKNSYTILLPSQPVEDLPEERVGWRYKVLKPARFWTFLRLPLEIYRVKIKPDIFFSPTHFIPRFTKVKRVVTIFDLSFLHYPKMFLKSDLYKLINWTKYSVLNSNHILTISESSKEDILKNYKIKSNKITVSYPGFDARIYHQFKNTEKVKQVTDKYQVYGPYLIFVGTLQPRKNLVRLIEAFSEVLKNEGSIFRHLKLVIVGKTNGLGRKGWMYESILNRPKELGIDDGVIFTGYVPNEELPLLIGGAIATLQPSLYEGFGMTAVESMACGTPVIVSNVSSLPEVVGKEGILVDPNSTEQIAQAISTIATEKKLRARLSKAGLVRIKKFSWNKMAKDTLKIFERVA